MTASRPADDSRPKPHTYIYTHIYTYPTIPRCATHDSSQTHSRIPTHTSTHQQENVGLPDSLLSRFDLLFIVLDQVCASIIYYIYVRVYVRVRVPPYTSLTQNPTPTNPQPSQIDPAVDRAIAEHVIRAHSYRRPGADPMAPERLTAGPVESSSSGTDVSLHVCVYVQGTRNGPGR
jgi:hypothetical protein